MWRRACQTPFQNQYHEHHSILQRRERASVYFSNPISMTQFAACPKVQHSAEWIGIDHRHHCHRRRAFTIYMHFISSTSFCSTYGSHLPPVNFKRCNICALDMTPFVQIS